MTSDPTTGEIITEEELARRQARAQFQTTALPNDQALAQAAGRSAMDTAVGDGTYQSTWTPSPIEPRALPQPIAPPPPIQAPAAPVQPPGMHKESQQTTRTREIAAPGEAAAVKRLDQTYEKLGQNVTREGDLLGEIAGKKAEGEAKIATERDAQAQGLQAGTAEENAKIAAAQGEVNKARDLYDAESKKLASMQPRDYYEGKWGKRIGDAVLVGLGEFGRGLAAMGGIHTSNTALDILREQHQEWYAQEKERIERQRERKADVRERVGMAQQDVSTARASKADRINDLNIVGAAKINALQQHITAEAAQRGTEFAKNQAEKMNLELEKDKNQHFLQYQQGLRDKLATTTQSVSGTGVGGAGATKASSEDLAKIGSLENDINGIDRTIAAIKKNPKAWNEYRKNEERWQRAEAFGNSSFGKSIRGMEQASGIGPHSNISVEQGLKTPDAKLIHQGVQGAKIGIAKGYGGVITSGDTQAAGSELTTLANDPNQAVETLMRVRARLANSRDVYMRNRAVSANPTPQAPSAAAPSAGIPPGAVMGRMNGKRGYAIGGQFYPLE